MAQCCEIHQLFESLNAATPSTLYIVRRSTSFDKAHGAKPQIVRRTSLHAAHRSMLHIDRRCHHAALDALGACA
jgi:hypothetical protein